MKSTFLIDPNPPKILKGHEIALQEWKRVLKLPGHRITAFDSCCLANYCLVIEEEKILRSISACVEKTIKEMQTSKQHSKLQIRKTRDLLITQRNRIVGKRKLARQLAESLYLDPPVFLRSTR